MSVGNSSFLVQIMSLPGYAFYRFHVFWGNCLKSFCLLITLSFLDFKTSTYHFVLYKGVKLIFNFTDLTRYSYSRLLNRGSEILLWNVTKMGSQIVLTSLICCQQNIVICIYKVATWMLQWSAEYEKGISLQWVNQWCALNLINLHLRRQPFTDITC